MDVHDVDANVSPVGWYLRGDRVYLRGVLMNTDGNHDGLLFTIGAGFRPAGIELFTGHAGGSGPNVIIGADGSVVMDDETSNVALSGISFQVAP